MKVICFAFGLALLLVGIADFFSSPASAAPRGSMSGSDMTYGKTRPMPGGRLQQQEAFRRHQDNEATEGE
jgi:hypothetical protein